MRIIVNLESGGYLLITKEGTRNHYTIQPELTLDHPLTQHITVGELIALLHIPFVN